MPWALAFGRFERVMLISWFWLRRVVSGRGACQRQAYGAGRRPVQRGRRARVRAGGCGVSAGQTAGLLARVMTASVVRLAVPPGRRGGRCWGTR